MRPYTSLCANLIFPLHERLKGHRSVAVRQRLERSQWLPRDQIEALQLQRLKAFLQQVGQCVPYYQDLFQRAGFNPAGMISVRDLQALPLLGKPLIRANTDALKAQGHGPLARYNTGGSSGEPLIFYIGKDRTSHDVGAKWRVTRWWDVDIGDRELVVWGSPVELGAQDRVRRLRDAVMRSHLLPAFEMSEARLDVFIQRIRSYRPRMMFGYPSALSHIAQHAQRRGVALNDMGVKVVFVTSERLYDHQRAAITAAFGCPVANGYGARDAGFIAHECPAGGMHVMAEDIVVELVDPQGQAVAPGEAGEIVVTHLGTSDFPFVRYRTGDVARSDPRTCSCGRGLPLLKQIEGRTTDFVVAADGTVMHGLALIYVLRDLPGLKAFKITQHTALHTQVQLVPETTLAPELPSHIVQAFQRRLGAQVQVAVQVVDAIAPEKSGKHRYVVSHAAAQPAAQGNEG
jgi:phenylacetate-CoA ligase